jgi:hypothetical protein
MEKPSENELQYGKHPKTEEQVMQKIVLRRLGRFKRRVKNIELCRNSSIKEEIFV